ncbi:hypothetical protein MPTK1_5g01300 [Marchantia polymorpha subsp. ruderalis]|uniref:Uncharacterized protein n=2 Tax=Marchantia polymorpha TaxID=3197 RepID=A0AAF6BDR6_MARPO|nr:hypothetical protein MARPO_1134s0001 [Marchantia polymorpha]BBN10150.1 hypothetical protein Mp_5g01300 [Marchantia polymorpha subsp. ruderalis]|eukprot:PTQ26531.1 hypothetical protein MARPO_1134s0001 [Marchantia polymorpha]
MCASPNSVSMGCTNDVYLSRSKCITKGVIERSTLYMLRKFSTQTFRIPKVWKVTLLAKKHSVVLYSISN